MTIFERIIAREIPATIEYEDSDVIAIQDIQPNAPVHILIIPKVVIPGINDIEPHHHEIIGKVFSIAKELAKKHGIADTGYRVVTNVNKDAGQTVFHLHFHLLGGEPLGAMNGGSTVQSGTISKPPSKFFAGRELLLFAVASVGLAVAFNMMNPKRIPWLKPTFEHTQASDALLGLPTQPEETPTTTNPSVPVDAGNTENEKSVPTEKPNAMSGVVSTTPEKSPKEQTPAFTPQPGVVLEISLSQFKRLLAGPHFLIDARTPESYSAGHIGKAINVYGGEVEGRIPELLGIVPTDKVILIYCDGGECELSHHVADALKQFGYGPICIFTGGWAEWTKKKAVAN